MLVYSGDKSTFLTDVADNRISDRILTAMTRRSMGGVSKSERRSWEESLNYMKNVVEDPHIPDDAGIAVEYRIPQTSKRVDVIISGLDEEHRESCVIIELKQWQHAEATGKDAIVRTRLGGGIRETTHPSYQAWSYSTLLEDYNETVQNDEIRLTPCAYLHNCTDGSGLQDPLYDRYLQCAPLFLRHDIQRLREFIRRHVRHGDHRRVLYRIEQGRVRPSKDLASSLARLIRGNRDFLMIDDQKVAYEAALEVATIAQGSDKQVLIVEGGPGTGKSVVAINLLVELTRRHQTVHYVTPNRAPRQVYEGRLTGTLTKTRFSNLFKGSAAYDKAERDELDGLLVDEAHRLQERSQWQRAGTNQIRDIIRAARTSVFFVDEAQQVTWNDTGSIEEIERWARAEGPPSTAPYCSPSSAAAVLMATWRGSIRFFSSAIRPRTTCKVSVTTLRPLTPPAPSISAFWNWKATVPGLAWLPATVGTGPARRIPARGISRSRKKTSSCGGIFTRTRGATWRRRTRSIRLAVFTQCRAWRWTTWGSSLAPT